MTAPALRRLSGVLASVLLLACAPAAKAAVWPGWEESGQASWYGGWFNGRRTSSGTIYNQNAMTAAHASLPLGTRVRVTKDDTGDSVVVTITDRQPEKGLRVIDLSRGAASRLGLLASGVGMVTLTPADDQPEEVAEAPDEAGTTPRLRDRQRMRRAVQAAWAARPWSRAPSEAPAQR